MCTLIKNILILIGFIDIIIIKIRFKIPITERLTNMKKTFDKNKVLLLISAILIIIAIIITCSATIYEKKAMDNSKSSEVISGADGPVAKDDNSSQKPETTKPQKTESNKAGKYSINTQTDPLGIRRTPEDGAERLTEIPKDTEIQILCVYDDWGYVEYNGTNGWVPMEYVKEISLSIEAPKHKSGTYKIATKEDPLGIRSTPDTDAQRGGEVPRNAEVKILATCGEWGLVKYNGEWGWLSFEYLEKVS